MKFLIFVLLFEKIAFVVVDAAYMLRLIQKGFPKEGIFPFFSPLPSPPYIPLILTLSLFLSSLFPSFSFLLFLLSEMSTIVLLTLPCEIIFPILIGKFIDNTPLLSLVSFFLFLGFIRFYFFYFLLFCALSLDELQLFILFVRFIVLYICCCFPFF